MYRSRRALVDKLLFYFELSPELGHWTPHMETSTMNLVLKEVMADLGEDLAEDVSNLLRLCLCLGLVLDLQVDGLQDPPLSWRAIRVFQMHIATRNDRRLSDPQEILVDHLDRVLIRASGRNLPRGPLDTLESSYDPRSFLCLSDDGGLQAEVLDELAAVFTLRDLEQLEGSRELESVGDKESFLGPVYAYGRSRLSIDDAIQAVVHLSESRREGQEGNQESGLEEHVEERVEWTSGRCWMECESWVRGNSLCLQHSRVPWTLRAVRDHGG